MAEIRPIVGGVTGSDRFNSSNRQNNQDPFSITGDVVPSSKVTPRDQAGEALNQMQQQRSGMLSELSKGLLKPITENTNVQSSEMRELVAATKILEASSDKMSKGLQEKIFISPEELQSRLLTQDKGETSFSGGAFDVLRLISKLSSPDSAQTDAAKELAKIIQNMNGSSAKEGAAVSAEMAAAGMADAEAMAESAMAGTAPGDAAAQAAGAATATSVEEAYTQMLAQLAEEGAVTGLAAGEEAAEAAGPAAAGVAAEEAALAADAEALSATGSTETAAKAETVNLANSLSEAIAGKQLSAKGEAVQNSVVNILRHFDCYTNQDQSLQAISGKLAELQGKVSAADQAALGTLIENLQGLIRETGGTSDGTTNPYSQVQNMMKEGDILQMDSESMEKTQTFLKDTLVPELSKLVAKYNQADAIRNPITSIIHYIARYDKADPAKLSKALDSMGEVLSNIEPFTAEDAQELKTLILDAARDIRADQKVANIEKDFLGRFGAASMEEKGDMAAFLSQALDDDSPAGVQKLAMNLLTTMVENESPAMPLMHFMVPIDYNGSNTYLEMYVDKDAEGRKGKADSAVNIFFTIESEDYGTFEVDMLERDGMIDLDIKAPTELQRDIRQAKASIRSAVENSGFRLALYRVAPYSESTSVASHFKELKKQKSGMDIKA